MPKPKLNSPELKQFIRDHAWLWWYVKEDKKENLSHESVIEFVLNFGDEKMCKRLFEILGTKYVAKVFYKQTAPGRRVNYFPAVTNYFNLYFKRNA